MSVAMEPMWVHRSLQTKFALQTDFRYAAARCPRPAFAAASRCDLKACLLAHTAAPNEVLRHEAGRLVGHRPSRPPDGVLADAMHGSFAGSVTVTLSTTTSADTRAAVKSAAGRPALQGFIAAGRGDDVAGGLTVHGPSAVDAARWAQAARQLPCTTALSFASAGELAVPGLPLTCAHGSASRLCAACCAVHACCVLLLPTW